MTGNAAAAGRGGEGTTRPTSATDSFGCEQAATGARLKVGIVGAGQIASSYARDLDSYPELEFVGVADLSPERAQAVAASFSTRALAGVEDLLEAGAELVINTTSFAAHGQVTRRCLLAGRHVYSEKPLAMTPAEAHDLVRLADAKDLGLASAPCTILGEAQQTAWQLVRDGCIGPVRTVFAEAHGGRIESWHPTPAPFLAAGPMADVGIYPLTLLTAMLGPVREVIAHARVLRDQRTASDESVIDVTTPDFVVAVLTLEDGATVRLTTSFDVPRHAPGSARVEFHGDDGRLRLEDWQQFAADVHIAPPDGPFAPVPHIQEARHEVENGRGVRELAAAIADARPGRTSARQAAHLVDVLAAVDRSARTRRPVAVTSTFPPVAPATWARAEATRPARPNPLSAAEGRDR